jgi:hypothetical protein
VEWMRHNIVQRGRNRLLRPQGGTRSSIYGSKREKSRVLRGTTRCSRGYESRRGDERWSWTSMIGRP